MKIRILFFLSAFFTLSLGAQAQINSDSLWAVWQNTEESDSNRLSAVGGIVQYEYLFSQPDSAFLIAEEMYELADSTGFPKWMERARNYQGISHAIRGNHREAITCFSECLEINEKEGNDNRVAGSLNNIGLLYKEIDDYEQSIEYLNRALIIYETIADTNGQALTLGNIAMLHHKLGEFEKSLPLAKKSLTFFESIGDKKGIANSYSSLGTTNGSLGDAAKKKGNLSEAKTYHLKALDYYQKALPLREEARDKDGIAVTLHGMGMIYYQLGDDVRAIDFVSRALKYAEEVNSFSSIRSATGELTKFYKSKGQYKQAFEMYEYYNATNDSILSQENQRAVIRQEFDYEYEKQVLADSLAEAERAYKQNLSHQVELREKDRNRNILLTLGLLALILAIGFWSRSRFIKSANIKLAAAKDRAEQSEKYKEQFLANMSHEIRTPMHAISGMVKILERNEHPPTQDVFLSAMKTSADNLVVILNDVLDLSKIEAGKLDIERIPVKSAAVLENVTQILKYKAEEKGLALRYQIAEDVPLVVLGDPTRLNQILLNLTGNAIKFTEKGSVDILLVKNEGNLRFSIKDTGIGIPKDRLESIFGAFEQAEGSTSRHYGGTGLGLSISKQLTELQDGKIWVESEEGQGSIFYVELPIVAASADAIGQDLITEEKLKTMAASLKGLRILLAEDNPFNQMIAQDDLSFYIDGVTIDTAKNGALAVEKFQQENYDLILMDVQMPEMNGFEATRKIREIEKSAGKEKPIPIIAMTASLLKSEVDSCYDAGMDNYIPKPYKPEELIGAIYEELKK